MSKSLTDALWYASPQIPMFLKCGVLGALCAWAHDDGTFLSPPTLKSLADHAYPKDRTLHERTVQFHLRLLEAFGVVSSPRHVGGRGHVRTYHFHPAALSRLTMAAVRESAYVKGAFRRKGAFRLKGAFKGAFPAPATVRSQPVLEKEISKKEKEAPAGDLWARTLERSGISKHYRLAHVEPFIRQVAVRGPVLRLHVDDPDMRGVIQRCYLTQLCTAADAVQRGTQIELVSMEHS